MKYESTFLDYYHLKLHSTTLKILENSFNFEKEMIEIIAFQISTVEKNSYRYFFVGKDKAFDWHFGKAKVKSLRRIY